MEFCKMNVLCSKHQNCCTYGKITIRAIQQRFEPKRKKVDRQTQPLQVNELDSGKIVFENRL